MQNGAVVWCLERFPLKNLIFFFEKNFAIRYFSIEAERKP